MINIDNITQMGYFPIMTYDEFVILKHPMVDHFIAVDEEGAKEVALVKTLNFPVAAVFNDEIIHEYSYCGELDRTCHKREDEWYAIYAWFNIIKGGQQNENTN